MGLLSKIKDKACGIAGAAIGFSMGGNLLSAGMGYMLGDSIGDKLNGSSKKTAATQSNRNIMRKVDLNEDGRFDWRDVSIFNNIANQSLNGQGLNGQGLYC